MNNRLNNKAYKLGPGEKFPQDMLDKLKVVNDRYSNSKDHHQYMEDLRVLFNIHPVTVSIESQGFLGGYVEGEGSVNVSMKKTPKSAFGLYVDPEFSITQHVNGFSTLHLALQVFKTGRVRFKSGSNATLTFSIDTRLSITEKVLPFYDRYVKPFTCQAKADRLILFKELLKMFDEGQHLEANSLINNVLPIWDQMRMQTGQSNQSFESLKEAQDYVREFCRKKAEK